MLHLAKDNKLMRIRWILASSILVALLVIGASARVSLGDAVQTDTSSIVLESSVDDLSAGECVAPVDAATELMEIEDQGANYECPRGVPYCQQASQCADYCGGGFEVCSRGCCTCAG
jgi:hypothetical protein